MCHFGTYIRFIVACVGNYTVNYRGKMMKLSYRTASVSKLSSLHVLTGYVPKWLYSCGQKSQFFVSLACVLFCDKHVENCTKHDVFLIAAVGIVVLVQKSVKECYNIPG